MFYLFFIVLSLLLFFGKTLIPSAGQIIYGGDLLSQFYFWKGYLVDNLQQGIIPFWNPYNFSGTPFLSHPAVATFYPATILYLMFPLQIAFSWNYFIHLLIGSLGMYVLGRLYADKITSLFSAVVFALSGYFAARIYAGHVDLLTGAVWMPWIFYSFKKLIAKPNKKNVLVSTLFLVLQILAGYQAYVLFILEFITLYFIYKIVIAITLKKQRIFLKIISFVLPIIFSILITAIQWLPTWQLARESIRGQGMSYDLASWGSLPLSGIRLFLDPLNREELNKIVFNLGGGPLPNPFDHFTGIIPIAIVVIFLSLKLISYMNIKAIKRYVQYVQIDKDFWFFLIACFLFLAISLGSYLPLNIHNILYNYVPFYKFIRIPLQHLIIVVFLVPIMSGMCLQRIRNKWINILLVLLVVAELLYFGKKYILLTEIPDRRNDAQLISYLQKNLKGERLLPLYRVTSPVLNYLDLNAPLKYKLATTSGYDPVILKNYYDFIDTLNGSKASSISYYNVEIPPVRVEGELFKYLNSRYVLTEKGQLASSHGEFIPVLERGNYTLYRYNNTLSRFSLVNNKDCGLDHEGKISVISYSANKIILRVETDCEAILSTGEVYYPGWKAKIDGVETRIHKINVAFRSVYIPKGNHKVEIYYSPEIYYMGGAISLFGMTATYLIIKKVYDQI